MNRLAILPLIVITAVATWAAEPISREAVLHLTGSVRVLLEQRCNECHGSHLKEPDGQFGYVLDLEQLVGNPDYIVPGAPKKSEFYRLLQDGEMPPDDAPKARPLTPHEYDAVRRWIEIGAPTELPTVLPKLTPGGPPVTLSTQAEAAMADAKSKRITLKMTKRPAGEIVAEIAKRSGIRVDYQEPANEPRLSISLTGGTVYEALEYISLCGNYAFTFNRGFANIGLNPPPEIPAAQPPVVKKKPSRNSRSESDSKP